MTTFYWLKRKLKEKKDDAKVLFFVKITEDAIFYSSICLLGRQVYLYNMYYLQIGPNSNLIKYIVLRSEKESSAFFTIRNDKNRNRRSNAILSLAWAMKTRKMFLFSPT